MAASFQTAAPTKPKGRRASKAASTRIPNIRLSFITAKDQAQFETLFKSAVGNEQMLSGDRSRDILLRSGLDGDTLSQIWLVDTFMSVRNFANLIAQDSCRYYKIGATALSRVCLGHVPLQSKAGRKVHPFNTSRKHQE
jgi:hypothetical protein